ncbi:MAG TPA: DUF6599 family protein [Candidatus Sulfotelmatobacter sp.]|jgi:hypothetical protein
MSFSRFLSLRFLFAVALAGSSAMLSFAANKPALPSPSSSSAILPQEFGGWQMQGVAKTGNDPAVADPANATILNEYGFTDFASATYKRDDGRTVKIRAARFADASGGFGAYTLYLQAEMQKEEIGDQGASFGNRVLFYRGNVLVDALFSEESPMAGAELREFAGALPRPSGSAANLPPVLAFMPHRGYVTNTEKYAVGPKALGAFSPPADLDIVDFAASPEVTLGRYASPSGESTLMLIYYPTPQLASEHLRRMGAAHGVQFQPGVSGVQHLGEFFVKRTGPIVAIAAGPLSEDEAKFLLSSVNYEAKVTWNERTDNQEVRDLYTLLKNIVILCAVLGGFAVVAGIAFGGIRILMKKVYPDRVFDRPEQMEFISLRLTEVVSRRVPPDSPEP